MLTFISLILRGVAGGDGELGCLCGKAGTSDLCDGSAHSSGCLVNGNPVTNPATFRCLALIYKAHNYTIRE